MATTATMATMATTATREQRARLALLGQRPKPRKRRPPRQLEPTRFVREYARELLEVVDLTERVLRPLLDELPALLDRARAERVDAGEGKRIAELIEQARQRVAGTLSADRLEELAARLGERVSTFQRIQLLRQINAVLGVDLLVSDTGMRAIIDGFAAENAALIKNVSQKLIDDVAMASTRAVASGKLHRDLAKEIGEKLGFARDRARIIARDQVGKLYGQANETRQKNVGIGRYIWRTSRDRRVRGTPGGAYPKARYSHYDREGQTFVWDEPPPDGHPGEPILCRCYAEPVISDLLE